MPSTFRCVVITPERQILDEEVAHATIPAWDGQIGLLHQRAPLLVKLGDGPMRLDTPAGEQRFYFVSGGFAQMRDDRLTVLTDLATPAEEIDRPEAEAALAEAQARVARTDEELAGKQRDIQRAREMLRLVEDARR